MPNPGDRSAVLKLIIQANALHLPIASETVQCVVTSPPYWGLRDYGTARWDGGDKECDHSTARSRGDDIKPGDKQGTSAGSRPNTQYFCPCGAHRIDSQLGLERTPEEYVANMVAVFREARRVLKDDGTLWINIGDSYATDIKGSGGSSVKQLSNAGSRYEMSHRLIHNLQPKNLVGIPWRIAFALQADGWYLRSDIIWSKPNPMPESVTDRPTKSHEYLFLLAKSERYFYAADAIQELQTQTSRERSRYGWNGRTDDCSNGARTGSSFKRMAESGEPIATIPADGFRNKRSVWTIATQPYSGAHFATFPEKLVEPCILAGSRPGDIVFDPFVGSGTVIRVATRHQRRGVGCDLNVEYLAKQAKQRIKDIQVEMHYG